MDNIFRTIYTPEKFPFELNYDSKIVFIGSCFSENIGQRLDSFKFNVDINPFGILYNPLSIKNSLDLLVHESVFTEENLFYFNERWNSFFHHSRFSGKDRDEVLQNINLRLKMSSEFLANADYLFLTFGTSKVYEFVDTNEIVSNCHKIPSKKFVEKLLTPDEIIVEYYQLINKLRNFNPKLKIIFTVSPIRHLKDGFLGNTLSKSILVYAINRINAEFNKTYYFPAYEIVNDDLRDYRFYAEDMLHLNNTAINYVLESFEKCFFSEETVKIKDSILKLHSAFLHRPFSAESKAFKDFCRYNILEVEKIEKKVGNGRLKLYKDYFESYL
jgi:hypothetical protein